MSQRSSLPPNRRPLQAMSPTNKPIKSPSNPKIQWVLMDDMPPVQVKMCSVSLDLLHTCHQCDKDFATLDRLMVHIKLCGLSTNTISLKTLDASRAQRTPDTPPPKAKVTTKKTATKRKIDLSDTLPKRVLCFATNNKKSAMESLGLIPTSEKITMLTRKKIAPIRRPLKLPNKVLKGTPFTHLPKELHLRSFNFQPCPRLEVANAEKITNNWMKVDAVCPAYPAGHRRHQSFIPRNQSFSVFDICDVGLRKRFIRIPVAKKEKRQRRKSKPVTCRLQLLRVSEMDIKKAEMGLNINGIIQKYSGTSKRSTRSVKTETKPASITPPVNTQQLVVTLERLPSNVVAMSKHSPVKASSLDEDVKEKIKLSPETPSKMLRDSVIQFAGKLASSPRRLLPCSSVVDISDDSDDEVIFLGEYF